MSVADRGLIADRRDLLRVTRRGAGQGGQVSVRRHAEKLLVRIWLRWEAVCVEQVPTKGTGGSLQALIYTQVHTHTQHSVTSHPDPCDVQEGQKQAQSVDD